MHDWEGIQLFRGRVNFGYASGGGHLNQGTGFDKMVAKGSTDSSNMLDVVTDPLDPSHADYIFVNNGWAL